MQLPRWKIRSRIAFIRTQQNFFGVIFLRELQWSSMLSLIFPVIVYPSLCSKIFLVFKCEQIGSKWYLSQDRSVGCNSSQHAPYQMVAGILIFVYVIGIPLLLLIVLLRNRTLIKTHPERPTLQASIFLPICDISLSGGVLINSGESGITLRVWDLCITCCVSC